MKDKPGPGIPKQGTYYSVLLPDGSEVGGIVMSIGDGEGMNLTIGIQPLGTTDPKYLVEVPFSLDKLHKTERKTQ